MTISCPTDLTDAMARIGLAGSGDVAVPEDLTGELRTLAQWWGRVSSGSPPRTQVIEDAEAQWPDVAAAASAGLIAANRAVDAGATLLIPRVAHRDDLTARTIVAILARTEPQDVVPQPSGRSDRDWMRSVSIVRDRAHQATIDGISAWEVLADVDARGIAFCVGALLAASARRTPCIIDGTDESAAAVVADRLSAQAHSWWLAGSQSDDPARRAVAERVPFAPGVPLALTDENGRGAAATAALLQLVTGG